MALLDFEHFGRETNLALSNWFTATGGGMSVSSDGAGPFDYGRYCNAGGSISKYSAFADQTTIYAQFHLWATGLTEDYCFTFTSGSTVQCSLRYRADGKLRFARGTTTALGDSAAPVIAINAWYFIQIRVNIAAAGSYEVRVNGQTVISGTGNTQALAGFGADGWQIRNLRFANILLYNESGTQAPNTWTPETRIYADLPNAAGASSGWTPSAAANYQCVDEQPNNGDTDYVSAAAAGPVDSYACAATAPAGTNIYAVAVEIVARKDDAGTNEVDCLLRTGGSDFASGSSAALTTTYQRFRRLWTQDPATAAAWTRANANAAQPGIERTA